MKQTLAHIMFLLVLMSAVTVAEAQRYQRITGRVVRQDGASSDEPLPYADISLRTLPDSSFVKGAVSNGKGYFTLGALPERGSAYLLKVSFTGYIPLERRIEASRDSVIRLGTIRLEEDQNLLEEVIVRGEARPVVQKGDTTLFNVSAYRTPEGSYLEALIKRIPGLNYNPETKEIKYNGYEIGEILVNGREFFRDNPEMALRNLPVGIIRQVRVYDKASDEEEATGMRTGEKHYVIDLQTKQELNGMLNAEADIAYGNHRKRELNGRMMRFDEEGNLMLNAQSTNTHYTSTYAKNLSNAAGLNFSRKFNDKIEFSADVDYNDDRSGNEVNTKSELYLNEGNQFSASQGQSVNKNRSLGSRMEVSWTPDKKTTVNLSGNFSLTRSHGEDVNRSATFNEAPSAMDITNPFAGFEQTAVLSRINRNSSETRSEASGGNYGFRGSLIRRFGEKGHSIGLNMSVSHRNSENENFTYNTTHYYLLPSVSGGDSVLYRNQYIHTPSTTDNRSVGLSYTHVINKNSRIQLAYSFSYSREKMDGNTYDLSIFPDAPAGTLPDGYASHEIDSLYNRSRSRTVGHNIALRYSLEWGKWMLHASVSMNPQRRSIEQVSGIRSADTTAFRTEWQPSLSLSYQRGESHLMILYGGMSRQPRLSDLVSPTDYSSPLNITHSNPNLKQSYSHQLNIMYNNFQKGISGSCFINQDFNAFNRATVYNASTGGRETFPVNTNGNWGVSANVMYEKSIRQFRISAAGNGTYRDNVSLISGSSAIEKSITHLTGLGSMLRLSYLPQWGDWNIGGTWDFLASRNTLQNNNSVTRNYTVRAEGTAYLPLNIQWNTDATVRLRGGTGVSEANRREVVWNMRASWKFLRSKRAELAASWVDILNQSKSYVSSATSTGFFEQYEEQIGSYFLISLIYRFDKAN